MTGILLGIAVGIAVPLALWGAFMLAITLPGQPWRWRLTALGILAVGGIIGGLSHGG